MASVPTGTFLTAQYVKKRARLNTLSEAPSLTVEDTSANSGMLAVPTTRSRFFSWGNQDKSNFLSIPGAHGNPSSPGLLSPNPGASPSPAVSPSPGISPAPSPVYKFFHNDNKKG